VLLVEDEAIIALSEKMILERNGFSVIIAHDGEKAIEAVARRGDIGLVLMDINLGSGMDGTEAAGLILKTHELPLIFLSSHTEREVVEKTEGITSFGYIVKNSGETVLIASIKMALKLYDAQRNIKEQGRAIEKAYADLQVANEELQQTVEELNFTNIELEKSRSMLAQSEGKYRFLVENNHDLIYTLSAEGVFLFVSPAWTKMLGHPVSEVVGKSYLPFVHPEDISACQAWLANVINSAERIENIVYRVRHIDGRWLWHSSSAVPLRDEQGEVTGFEGTARDISEQKRVEDELLKEKCFTEALLESLPGYLFVYDQDGRLIRWNKKHETMTGYSSDELSRMTMSQWFEGEDALRVSAAVKKVFETGYGEVDAHLLIKGGGKLFIHSTGARLIVDGKTYFTGVGIDISERARVEHALRVSEAKYRTLFETLPLGITIADAEGRVVESNRVAEKILGLPDEQHRGRAIGSPEWIIIKPDGSPMAPEDFASTRALKEQRLVENVRMGIVKSDGEVVWLNVSATPVPLEGYGVAIAYMDISDRVRDEESIRALRSKSGSPAEDPRV
jgi:PAS domain S-box-containing protein